MMKADQTYNLSSYFESIAQFIYKRMEELCNQNGGVLDDKHYETLFFRVDGELFKTQTLKGFFIMGAEIFCLSRSPNEKFNIRLHGGRFSEIDSIMGIDYSKYNHMKKLYQIVETTTLFSEEVKIPKLDKKTSASETEIVLFGVEGAQKFHDAIKEKWNQLFIDVLENAKPMKKETAKNIANLINKFDLSKNLVKD